MSSIPNKTAELIAWAQLRAPGWVTNSAQIGITEEQAGIVQSAAGTAATALSSQAAAQAAARSSTEVLRAEARDLRRAVVDTVKLIRIFAENQPTPALVYQLAQIPAPATPAPLPPPGPPTDLSVTLTSEGFLQLRWKCQNPPGASGTVYLVERRVGSGGSFGFRAAVGERRFIDDTVPAGTPTVEYKIRGQRSDATGPAQFFTVRFGVGGEGAGGLTITSMSEEEAARMAA